jgi:hypothetical protein
MFIPRKPVPRLCHIVEFPLGTGGSRAREPATASHSHSGLYILPQRDLIRLPPRPAHFRYSIKLPTTTNREFPLASTHSSCPSILILPPVLSVFLGIDSTERVKQDLLPVSPFILIVPNSDLCEDKEQNVDQGLVRFADSSTRDFFVDPTRSQGYYVDDLRAHKMLLHTCT